MLSSARMYIKLTRHCESHLLIIMVGDVGFVCEVGNGIVVNMFLVANIKVVNPGTGCPLVTGNTVVLIIFEPVRTATDIELARSVARE